MPFNCGLIVTKQYEISNPNGTVERYIEGHVSTYNTDLQYDRFSQEALTKTLYWLTVNTTSLFNHNEDKPIGKIVEARVDEIGLWVKILCSSTRWFVEEIWPDVVAGILNKFSIKGEVTDFSREYDPEAGRDVMIILEIITYEVSLVSVGAQYMATVTNFMEVVKTEVQKSLLSPKCHDNPNKICQRRAKSMNATPIPATPLPETLIVQKWIENEVCRVALTMIQQLMIVLGDTIPAEATSILKFLTAIFTGEQETYHELFLSKSVPLNELTGMDEKKLDRLMAIKSGAKISKDRRERIAAAIKELAVLLKEVDPEFNFDIDEELAAKNAETPENKVALGLYADIFKDLF